MAPGRGEGLTLFESRQVSQHMPAKHLFIFEMANNHMGDVSHGIRIIRELKEAGSGFDFRFAVFVR